MVLLLEYRRIVRFLWFPPKWQGNSTLKGDHHVQARKAHQRKISRVDRNAAVHRRNNSQYQGWGGTSLSHHHRRRYPSLLEGLSRRHRKAGLSHLQHIRNMDAQHKSDQVKLSVSQGTNSTTLFLGRCLFLFLKISV